MNRYINLLSVFLFIFIIGGAFSAINNEAGITVTYAEKMVTGLPESDEYDNHEDLDSVNSFVPFAVSPSDLNPEGLPVAYLTFDDGPSNITIDILDILYEYKIPATFFVTGINRSGDKNIYKRIAEEGHALGNHTFTHNMNKIYLSEKAFMKDFEKLEDLLLKETGIKPDIMRFPGGSSLGKAYNIAGYDVIGEVIKILNKKGYDYFDWNIDSQDGIEILKSEEIIATVTKEADKIDGDIVILFHDFTGNESTVEALPKIIKHLDEAGYFFNVLSNGVVEMKHRKK